MSKSALQRLRLPKCARTALRLPVHHLHTSVPTRIAVTLSPGDIWDFAITGNDPKETLIAAKLSDLHLVLTQERPKPDRVWGCYLDLLNFLGFQKLPVEIHRAVLRHCTPPASELRVAALRHMPGVRRVRGTHHHEGRFQAIIRNMRSSGSTPSLDDYHFILEQFAAVGYHEGVMQVLGEVSRLSLPKTQKTYGLCLQALCHRLTLPCWFETRPSLVAETLLEEMRSENMPLTSLNVGLALRILKETSKIDDWAKLLKVAYGIDMSYPDRPPLELWDQAVSGVPNGLVFPDPLPFSTAALNTTIDMLGRSGEISKLIQAFEVLTTPLPSQASNFSPSFDDEDEDDFGVSNPKVAPYRTPYAEPNTMTYQTLLKWISRHGHIALGRHYLLQAIALEKRVLHKLWLDLRHKPMKEIAAPRFAVNRNMLLSVYAEAVRNKNTEILRWVFEKAGQVIKTKRKHLRHSLETCERRRITAQRLLKDEEAPLAASDVEPSSTNNDASFSTFFTPTSTPDEHVAKTVEVPAMPYFDVDLDNPSRSQKLSRPFNIDLHIRLLEEEIEKLWDFYEHAADNLGRISQRVKERLGRRVWKEKDVYMRDERRRVHVGRAKWKDTVHFKPTRTRLPYTQRVPLRNYASELVPGSVATTRGIMTTGARHRLSDSSSHSRESVSSDS